jgi:hypothetical protein
VEGKKKKKRKILSSEAFTIHMKMLWYGITSFLDGGEGKKSDENANDFSELGRRKTGKNKNEKGEIFLISTLF